MGNSSCTHNSNAMPTAKPMFSGSSHQTVRPSILSDLTGSDKSKMAAANPEVLISPLVHMLAWSGATEFPTPKTSYYDLKLRC